MQQVQRADHRLHRGPAAGIAPLSRFDELTQRFSPLGQLADRVFPTLLLVCELNLGFLPTAWAARPESASKTAFTCLRDSSVDSAMVARISLLVAGLALAMLMFLYE
jgi:hypothetical protein